MTTRRLTNDEIANTQGALDRCLDAVRAIEEAAESPWLSTCLSQQIKRDAARIRNDVLREHAQFDPE